ncbi:MAG: flavin reductase domain protein FMN-binding protein [Solirubrobacterales bacterium]|nr:flavin reductase domain protein FMN-binding protein [Solirubrobacterales bacterium]
MATDRFTGVPWAAGHAGAPLLAAAVATLECTNHDVVDGGDHAVVLGRVTRVRHPEDPAEPLVFFGGRFRRLQAREA